VLDLVLAILAVVSLGLTCWRWSVALAFPLHRRMPASPEPQPGVTFLKPLKGRDAETKRCLRSWFVQAYNGPMQILFGVADNADPVCAAVQELLAEFPQADARLIVCREKLGANAKVSTLRQLEPHIRHPWVMVSDADVEVPADFAAAIAPFLAAPGVGLVNCFYRLANPSNLAMRWEAVAVNSDFWSSVLQSRSLATIDFALGAVMSLPASVLRQIGGFVPLADYLADDYELGRRVAKAGGRIDLAPVAVDCRDATAGWKEVWGHQLRWARTIRVCRPFSYFMSVLANATLWPLLWFVMARNGPAAIFFAAALIFRVASAAQQQGRLTQRRDHFAYCWLAPVKDLLDVVIWAAAFWGNRVRWRGEPYRILSGGKLEPF
jgi:ceramide glucosyltransferase